MADGLAARVMGEAQVICITTWLETLLASRTCVHRGLLEQCSVWFLCETRSPRYRVRHLSREPCRFPRRPAKRERRTRSQHIEAPTIPTRSQPSKRPRLQCDRGLRGAQRSPHDRNAGSGLDPLRDSNSRPRVRGPFLLTLFPFGPL